MSKSNSTNPLPENFHDSVAVMIAENYQLPPNVYDHTYTSKERDTFINRYWGVEKRKYFPIDTKDMAKLYSDSDEYINKKGENLGKSIIVYVKNMHDRKLAQLYWLPYKKDTKWDYDTTSYYWILPNRFFDSNISENSDYYMGGISICEKADLICGLLGEGSDEDYYVFVNSIHAVYDGGLNNYGGAAGYNAGNIMYTGDGSTVGGIKIPSPGN